MSLRACELGCLCHCEYVHICSRFITDLVVPLLLSLLNGHHMVRILRYTSPIMLTSLVVGLISDVDDDDDDDVGYGLALGGKFNTCNIC